MSDRVMETLVAMVVLIAIGLFVVGRLVKALR